MDRNELKILLGDLSDQERAEDEAKRSREALKAGFEARRNEVLGIAKAIEELALEVMKLMPVQYGQSSVYTYPQDILPTDNYPGFAGVKADLEASHRFASDEPDTYPVYDVTLKYTATFEDGGRETIRAYATKTEVDRIKSLYYEGEHLLNLSQKNLAEMLEALTALRAEFEPTDQESPDTKSVTQ